MTTPSAEVHRQWASKARLTDRAVKNAKPKRNPYKLADGGGLYLLVKPNGSKLWRWKYRIAGSENVFAIGQYDAVGLSQARAARDEARNFVAQGIHPAHERRTQVLRRAGENANTFEAVANEWVEKNKARWSGYYLRQVERFLSVDAFPYVGALPIRAVTSAHLLEIVRRIENRGASSVAILMRQWCSAIFRYAVSTLRADNDPAVALRGAITRRKVEHRTPLSREQIPGFVAALQTYGGYRTTAIAMRLLMLTFVRPIELRGAAWQEFDLDHAEWRIPGERMKMRELHIVPLSRQAVSLLNELKKLTGGQGWLFPNYRRPKTFMTGTTLNRALERMGYGGKFSSHGFRATASTMLNEMGFRSDVIERQLAHKDRDAVRASYNQAEYLSERQNMMQTWANLLDAMAKDKKVIPGRFRRHSSVKAQNRAA